MKILRFIFALVSALLILGVTSLSEEPKSAFANAELCPKKAANNQTLHVRPPAIAPLTKSWPTNLRNNGLAIVGGPENKFRNTAAINGTGMKQR
jgi:hypothetical protein